MKNIFKQIILYFHQSSIKLVWQQQGKSIPLQVSVDITHPDTKAREVSGLMAAARYLQVDEGVIVTLDQTAQWQQAGLSIRALPAW
jgi:hypothetical protein